MLHAYCPGLYSSRRMAKACAERVDLMMIDALDAPDFRTIADFASGNCRRSPDVRAGSEACREAGWRLGHVALDGTKIKANASKHKAMSYERMKTREAELREDVDSWFEAADSPTRRRMRSTARPGVATRRCPRLVPLVDGVGGHLGRMQGGFGGRRLCSGGDLCRLSRPAASRPTSPSAAPSGQPGVNGQIGGALTRRIAQLSLAGRRSRYRSQSRLSGRCLDA